MTRQQIEAKCAEAFSWYNCCTELGRGYLTRYHDGTIRLLKLWHKGYVQLTNKAMPSIELLIGGIAAIRNDPTMYRNSPTQLAFEVE